MSYVTNNRFPNNSAMPYRRETQYNFALHLQQPVETNGGRCGFVPPLMQIHQSYGHPESINRTPNGTANMAKQKYRQQVQMVLPKNQTSGHVPNEMVPNRSSFKPKIPQCATDMPSPPPQTTRPVPKTARSVAAEHLTISKTSLDEIQTVASTNTPRSFKIFGGSEKEKLFVFTGTVERVIKWNKIFQNHFCYFEVIATVVSIQEGAVRTQKVMLLRDRKGPILQVVYYVTTHLDLENFFIGQTIRCVGKMTGQNIFNAHSIRNATQVELENLQRLCLVCDQAVSHYLNV